MVEVAEEMILVAESISPTIASGSIDAEVDDMNGGGESGELLG